VTGTGGLVLLVTVIQVQVRVQLTPVHGLSLGRLLLIRVEPVLAAIGRVDVGRLGHGDDVDLQHHSYHLSMMGSA